MAGKTTDIEEQIESPEMAASEANTPEMRVYELGFHIDGELPQEEAKKSYDALKDLAAKHGEVIAEGTLAKVQLAYTISRMDTTGRRDFNVSFFGWIAYETDGPGHQAVTAAVKEDTRVIRFLDLRTSKDAAKHSSEMHEFYLKVPEAPVEEDSSDAELDAALKEVGVA
jgi:ribosomal protein S6